jgi:hypothetical protein
MVTLPTPDYFRLSPLLYPSPILFSERGYCAFRYVLNFPEGLLSASSSFSWMTAPMESLLLILLVSFRLPASGGLVWILFIIFSSYCSLSHHYWGLGTGKVPRSMWGYFLATSSSFVCRLSYKSSRYSTRCLNYEISRSLACTISTTSSWLSEPFFNIV